jgi:hypothetical protein
MNENKKSTTILLKKRMLKEETYQKWIYIPSRIGREFPLGAVVDVRVGQKMMRMKISKYGHMSPETALWDQFKDTLDFDISRDILVFLKHKDGSLEIAIEKQDIASSY